VAWCGMHTSKLSTFVIDCKAEDLDTAASFWAAALQRQVLTPRVGEDRYRVLACAPAEPLIMIQRVAHESRVHLDIESDDLEAEVVRLSALGAKPIERVKSWVVMEAPTGQRFCVVAPQRPTHIAAPFAAKPEHAALASLAGHYEGTTRTFLDPTAPPDESKDSLFVESVLGGRWLRLQWFGRVAGSTRQGEMLLGFHVDAAEYELTWIDTFHTGTATMLSRGSARSDGMISVLGSYGAGSETWGWRTELTRTESGLSLRAINIAPAGDEYPAIQTDWVRRS